MSKLVSVQRVISRGVNVLAGKYDIAKGSLSEYPVTSSSKTINNLYGEVQLETSFSISTTATEKESFTHTIGTELSVGATFSAGVPLVAEAEISTTLTVSYKHQFGKTTSKSVSRTATLPCSAPPRRHVVCNGIIKVKKMSVPYTTTLKNKQYGCTCTSKGVYKSVQHTNIYLEPTTYASVPSGNEAEYAKLIEDRTQFLEDQSQLVEDRTQFLEDQSQLSEN